MKRRQMFTEGMKRFLANQGYRQPPNINDRTQSNNFESTGSQSSSVKKPMRAATEDTAQIP